MNIFGFSNQDIIQIGISLGIILLTLLLGRPILTFVLDRIIRRIIKFTRTNVDDLILGAVRTPLFWLVFIIVFQFSLDRLDFIIGLSPSKLEDLYFTLYISVSLIITVRLVNALIGWYGKEIAPKTDSDLDEQLVPFLRRIVVILLVVIFAIIILGRFDVEVSGLVTTLGIGSLAVALAAQAALSDTISGFMIMFDRPFRIGDRIEIQDLDTWGDVVDIGLRSTRIRTRDNRMVIVPNSLIGKSLVVNHSYPDTQYRIEIELGVAYDSDIEVTRNTIVNAVRGVEGVLQEKPVEALLLQFGDSALIFRVRWWIESYVDTRRMFDKVNTAMYHALNETGIEMPFPTQEVYHKMHRNDIPQFVEVFQRK
ncbi:MAG: mechanosensitive ion channel [Anaerolineales bacterium]|jgi:small-conductance mechanosensitive channel